MQDKSKELYMYTLGAVVVLLAFGFGALMIFIPVPEGSKDAVMMGAGVLFGMAVTVVSYFFGSSKSSSDKNLLLTGKDGGANGNASAKT